MGVGGCCLQVTGFVPQEDIMIRELTVKEILTFNARMRLPRSVSGKEVSHRQVFIEDCFPSQSLGLFVSSERGWCDPSLASSGWRNVCTCWVCLKFAILPSGMKPSEESVEVRERESILGWCDSLPRCVHLL